VHPYGPAVGANSYHQAIFQNGPLALKERTSFDQYGFSIHRYQRLRRCGRWNIMQLRPFC